jgi:hypothetical protein
VAAAPELNGAPVIHVPGNLRRGGRKKSSFAGETEQFFFFLANYLSLEK